jgi:shikimate kinase
MRKVLLAAMLVATIFLLVACGQKAVAEVKVTLEQDCKVVKADPAVSQKHGKIAFSVTNSGAGPATFAVHKNDKDIAELEDLKPGQTKSLKATLEDGTYELACETGGRVAGRTSFEVK